MDVVARTGWGVVATIKAPARDVLRFAAHYLEAGAARLHIYLDAPNPEATEHLQQHPRIRVITCGEWYWKRRGKARPTSHRTRQGINATHAYRKAETAWLAHVDVDEFLWSERPLDDLLSEIPADVLKVMVRPIECLSAREGLYKAAISGNAEGDRLIHQIYPEYGSFLKGGFMSHVKGKCIARTGLPDIRFRIHDIRQAGNKTQNKGVLDQADLCHHHSESWEHWRTQFDYRLKQGSYRSELPPNTRQLFGGLSKHELLTAILAEQGEDGLRAFYDEVTAAAPDVFRRLTQHGLVRERPLALDQKLRKHFPDFD